MMITLYYIVLLETWGDSKAIKNLPVDHNNKQAVLPWQPYCGHFHTELKGDFFLFIGPDRCLALSEISISFSPKCIKWIPRAQNFIFWAF